jgi:membrane protease YdiL (CAAX protease family)
MEAVMRRPLSTRAQLAMLVEGLAGDPEPARRDLGLQPAPFTAERLRPLVSKIERRAPFGLRLCSAPKLPRETPVAAAAGLFALCTALIAAALHLFRDPWLGLLVATGAGLGGGLLLPSVRRRVRPTGFRVVVGLLSAGFLYGVARVGVALLSALWPAWEAYARELYAWQGAHGLTFLGVTYAIIVFGEEVLWRGVVTRFAMERWGRATGIFAGAALYAAAHVASLNPLLVAAAFLFGLFWSWLYAATDDLVAPTVSHLAWDGLVLFVVPVV